MNWLRHYLLAMGGSLQLLNMVTFKDREALKAVPYDVRQWIYMAMDLLAGCLAYAVSSAQGTYTESTRRNFLLTHGLRFISSHRARKLHRTGVAEEKMNSIPPEPQKA